MNRRVEVLITSATGRGSVAVAPSAPSAPAAFNASGRIRKPELNKDINKDTAPDPKKTALNK